MKNRDISPGYTSKIIGEKTIASIEFTLSWQSFGIHHTDCFFARKVNFYRDILPQKITDLLLGKMSGDTIEIPSIMAGKIIPAPASAWQSVKGL